jgi:CheY-like chemotaxis protein
VLVIDNNPELLTLTTSLLDNQGYVVLEARPSSICS